MSAQFGCDNPHCKRQTPGVFSHHNLIFTPPIEWISVNVQLIKKRDTQLHACGRDCQRAVLDIAQKMVDADRSSN